MTISGARRAEFIESFARAWTSRGASRTEGRIAAYLLLDESDGVTAAQIAADLDVSTGSVSNATRSLADAGFLHHERRPGERATRHFMARDVWGRFLQHERPYLQADSGSSTRRHRTPKTSSTWALVTTSRAVPSATTSPSRMSTTRSA